MNEQKITELCARAAGANDNLAALLIRDGYDPLHNTDQALSLLEHVADEHYATYAHGRNAHKEYWAQLDGTVSASFDGAVTKCLALVICALRASPAITDAELTAAMEE